MSSMPLIGLTAYEMTISQDPFIRMAGVNVDYKDAVIAAGGIPVLIPVNISAEQQRQLFNRLDGLLLPGGGDINPARYRQERRTEKLFGISDERDEIEIELACMALQAKKPLLAICRGHQVLNVTLGGTLHQHVADTVPDAVQHAFFNRPGLTRDHTPHNVTIDPNSRLASLLGTTETPVNSIHHQGVDQLGRGLVATAWSPDGLIEAIEYPDHPFAIGVQWHPENIVNKVPAMRGLFKGFIEAAAA